MGPDLGLASPVAGTGNMEEGKEGRGNLDAEMEET